MKNIKTFEDFVNESLNEANVFDNQDDMNANWQTKLKKPADIFASGIREWELYQSLAKKKPSRGERIKIQTPLFKYGIIKDKSFFNGPNKYWEVYEITDLISNDIMKIERKESGGRGYTELLLVKGHGIYVLGGNGYDRDLAQVPDEFKKFIN
jgi:hypothetical protein